MTAEKPTPSAAPAGSPGPREPTRPPRRTLSRRVVLISIALAISLVLLVWLGWNSCDSYHQITASQQYREAERLRGTILHLDEVLTMSARMAVLTGEPKWEQRYDIFEPELRVAIQEARALAPTAQGAEEAERTEAANDELVKMERRAMALLHEGDVDQARALLFSDRYEEQKEIYAQGMAALERMLADIMAEEFSQARHRAIADMVAGAVMIALIVLAWGLTISAARNWMAGHQRADAALKFQAALLDQIGDGITATDMEGRITYVNAAQATHMGHTAEDIIGQPVTTYGDDRARGATQQEILTNTIRDGNLQGEIVNYAKDGSESLVDLHTWVVLDEAGKPMGLAGIGRDITEIKRARLELQKAHDELEQRVADRTAQLTQLNAELQAEIAQRKQAEQALRESEERHRTLFESSRDAIMTLAPPSWKFTSGNQATVEIFGAKDEEEFISLGPWELSPEFQPDGTPSAEKAGHMIETAVREGSHLFEWTHKRVNGEEFPATVLLTRMELGGQTLLQATVRDITERKRAEEAVLRAKEEWERTFDAVPDPITIIDEDYHIIRVNKAMADRLGLTKAECVGATCYRVIHNTDASPSFCPHARTMADGLEHSAEFYVEGFNGYFMISTSPLTDAAGHAIGSVHVAHDITERRQSEEDLRDSEAGLKQAQQLAQVGSWEWDLADDSVTLSDEMRHIYGLTEQDRFDDIFALVDAMVHPDNKEFILSDLRALAAGEMSKVPDTMTLQIVRPDGHVCWIVGTAPQPRRRDADGKPTVMMGTVHDITEQKAAEEALRESEKRYRQLVEGLNEGIAATDRNGIITFVNRAFAEIIGDSAEALTGSDFFGSINHYQRDAFRRALLDRSIGSPDYQIMLLRRDDKLLYLSMHGSPIMDDQGNHLGTLIVINDITKRRQAEESLKKAHRQLMYAGEQERHALAKDLHDSLGQQAVAMHLAVESLLTRAKQADDAYVQELARLSQACESLTEDIRNTCYGLYPPTLETLGLCSALRQLLRDNEHIIKAKMTCCEKCEDISLAPDVEIALFRIAQEAVSNVLRHGKAEHMGLNLEMEGMDVVLTVSDDGVDFDVENTEVGLGLLSMRERANAVGGSLEISSQPGRTSVVARILVGHEG